MTKKPVSTNLQEYKAQSGHLDPVYTLEIQTLPDNVDGILDAVMAVNPLAYGRYQRNASVTATGYETSQPQPNSTTTTHSPHYKLGDHEKYPVVELKISIERDVKTLGTVMDVVLQHHHYEEPVIYVREDWVSRAAYNPNRNNPNRWWNNGKGLPPKLV